MPAVLQEAEYGIAPARLNVIWGGRSYRGFRNDRLIVPENRFRHGRSLEHTEFSPQFPHHYPATVRNSSVSNTRLAFQPFTVGRFMRFKAPSRKGQESALSATSNVGSQVIG